jgi:hypothetical protein
MKNIDGATRFALNPALAYTIIDDEAVLMGTKDETLYGLNSVGTGILQKMAEQPMSVEQLKDHLLAQFDVDEMTCQTDVRHFLESLCADQLIVPVE